MLRAHDSGLSPAVFEYYTIASSVIYNDYVTCSSSSQINLNLMVFGVSGVNLNAPFDPSTSLPNYGYSSTGGTPSTIGALSNNYDFLFGFVSEGGGYGCTYPGLGFDLTLLETSGGPPCNVIEYRAIQTAGPYAANFLSTGSRPYNLIEDAVAPATPPPPPPAFDGIGSMYCGGSASKACTAPLSTNYAFDLIIAFCSVSSTSLTGSVYDSYGLHWALRAHDSAVSPVVYEYYATSSRPLVSDRITCYTSSNINLNLIVYGILGVNLNSPFDPSLSLPAYSYGNAGGYPSANFALTAHPDIIFGLLSVGVLGCAYPTLGYGLYLITTSGNAPCNEGETVRTTTTGAQTVYFGTTAGHPYNLIADAVEASASYPTDASFYFSPLPVIVSQSGSGGTNYHSGYWAAAWLTPTSTLGYVNLGVSAGNFGPGAIAAIVAFNGYTANGFAWGLNSGSHQVIAYGTLNGPAMAYGISIDCGGGGAASARVAVYTTIVVEDQTTNTQQAFRSAVGDTGYQSCSGSGGFSVGSPAWSNAGYSVSQYASFTSGDNYQMYIQFACDAEAYVTSGAAGAGANCNYDDQGARFAALVLTVS